METIDGVQIWTMIGDAVHPRLAQRDRRPTQRDDRASTGPTVMCWRS
ncbi:hypothetical protein [Microbacterium sp. LCT-H2]|nr:hypothetical protein [Microbacterium sp. LCT-H2]